MFWFFFWALYNNVQINVEAIEYLQQVSSKTVLMIPSLFFILNIPFESIFVSLLLKSILQVTDPHKCFLFINFIAWLVSSLIQAFDVYYLCEIY